MARVIFAVSRLVLFLFMSTPVLAVGPYVVTGLGVLSGYSDRSEAFSVNSRGQVVGFSESVGAYVNRAAFLWSPNIPNGTTGSMVDLGGLVPRTFYDDYNVADGINNRGQVVGNGDAGFSWRGFLWNPTTPNATTGSMFDLGPDFGVSSVQAEHINARGQAVGYIDSYTEGFRAFLWSPRNANGTRGSMVDLGVLPTRSDYSTASGINSMGQVVGNSSSYTAGGHAFLWTPTSPNGSMGSMIDLGALPGGIDDSTAFGINSFGQVVGNSFFPVVRPRAFLWSPASRNGTSGSMIDIGYLPGGDGSSTAYGINALGQVVGDSTVGLHPGQQYQDHHAFIWTPTMPNATTGAMVDLNTVLDPISGAGWIIHSARGINDRGQIVGIGIYDPDGPFGTREVVRGVLLTPVVPEANSIMLLAIGGIILNLLRRSCELRWQMN